MFSPPKAPLAPPQPQQPPMFGAGGEDKRPKKPSMQPTFLGAGDIPQQRQLGQKTLLGQ